MKKVKKSESNVTIIPSKKRGHAVIPGGIWETRLLNPYEFAVLSSILYCKPYGFDAGQLSYFFVAGSNAMANALDSLVKMGLVVRNIYNVYDSGIPGVGMPRTEYDYTVDLNMLDTLVERKKAEKLLKVSPSIAPARVPVKLSHVRTAHTKDPEKAPERPAPAMDAPSPSSITIPSGTRSIHRGPGTIHEIHLSHKAVILASDGYEADQKDKLQPFLDKLARDGNILPDLDTFVERFHAYLDVCYENADKWAELNGALVVPSKNDKAVNKLLLSLREPFNTVLFEAYEQRFFDLMNIQHKVVDRNSVLFVNELRDIYNKGGLERYFYSLPKRSPKK